MPPDPVYMEGSTLNSLSEYTCSEISEENVYQIPKTLNQII